MKKNIIIFATFWNEIDWIKYSLKQIELLNPKEIIICDGCFDNSKKIHSTDGTYEYIKKWAKKNNAKVISPIRTNKILSFYKIFKAHNKIKWYYMFSTTRIKTIIKTIISNQYRINQALTFQKMISLSKKWKENEWFMTYDSDQFYSDEIIEIISKKLNNVKKSTNLIGSQEFTFFKNFQNYQDNFDKRIYNNMPHKIQKNTNIIPTRDLVLENFNIFNIRLEKDKYNYTNKYQKISNFFHYKFKKDKKRLEEGYKLGDRGNLEIKNKENKNYKGKHPKLIEKYFNELKEFGN